MAHAQVHFFADSLGKAVTADVILPQSRTPSVPHAPHKVLWLLHGYEGNHYDWTLLTAVQRYARRYQLAVVMPSGHNSWYVDAAHGQKYYTFITEELPRKMRQFFPLSDKREDNFIAGLSMGGYGAMAIGLANPQKYSAIGCLSGGILPEDLREEFFSENELNTIVGDLPIKGTYKDPIFNAKQIVENSIPAPRIFHACGKDDTLILKDAHRARDFLSTLPGDPFRYTYIEDEGVHSWEYWDEHIKQFLGWLEIPETKEFI